MFRGEYEHTIDPKGRIKLPSKFWDILQNKYDHNLIITKFDRCLWAYPLEEWQSQEESLVAQPGLKREVRSFQRFFIGGAADCPVDKQRRFLVPPPLRTFAGLERDIVLVGMLRRFEIWDRAMYKPQMENVEENLEDIVANIDDFSF
jgi:MraZ protein